MSDSKIQLQFLDDNGDCQIESVWATKEGEYYRINNIPFLAENIGLNDLVKAEQNHGALYFKELIEASGHTAIQVIFFDETKIKSTCERLESIDCTWEGSHLKTLFSVDIPKDVNYTLVKEFLDKGKEAGFWDYKEACLAHKY